MAQVATLVCCDVALIARGLWSLVNVFDELVLPAFPAVHPGFDVVIGLTDLRGRGEAIVEAEIVAFQAEINDSLNAVIWSDSNGVDLTPQLSRKWLKFDTGELTFDRVGLYELRVLIDGKLLRNGTIQTREARE